MSTLAKVQEYLRNTPGSRIPDATKAVGYNGPPVKIKDGNLSGGRKRVRLGLRQNTGDEKRQANLRLRPPQTKEEQNQRRRQNYKRSSLRKQGVPAVIDHRIPLDRLGESVEGKSPEEAKQRIEELEQAYGPLGDRPQNRVIRGAASNERKRQQEAEVQRKLGEMEEAQPSSPESLAKSKTLSAQEVRDLVGFNQNIQSAVTFGLNVANGAVRFGQAVGSVVSALAATESR
jgi:hypothetical protein